MCRISGQIFVATVAHTAVDAVGLAVLIRTVVAVASRVALTSLQLSTPFRNACCTVAVSQLSVARLLQVAMKQLTVTYII